MLLVLGAGLVLAAAVGPLHVDRRVIVGNAALGGGVVDVGALVAELGHIGQHDKAVGEALGDPEHLLVVGGQRCAHPLAEGLAVGAAVDGDIEHLAQGHADELALGVLGLEVQAAQHALGGAALVILHEGFVDARCGELVDLVGLHKIAAVIAKNSRLDDLHVRNIGLDEIELAHGLESPFYIS